MKTPDANPNTPDDVWDALFRQRLGDYTDQPPADALNRILAEANPPRPPVYGRWLPVGLVVLLLIGVGGWLLIQNEPTGSGQQQTDRSRIGGAMPGKSVYGEPANPDRFSRAGAGAIVTTTDASDKEEVGSTAGQINKINRLAKTAISGANVLAHDPRSVGTNRRLPAEMPGNGTDNPFPPVELGQKSLPGNAPSRTSRQPVNRRHSAGTPTAASLIEPIPGQQELGEDFREQSASVLSMRSTQTESRMSPIGALRSRPYQPVVETIILPVVTLPEPVAVPEMSRTVHWPSWFMSVTPLYTYQQIDPIRTDAELVSDIRVARPLAADRLGGRLQFGAEWQLATRLRLRTSLVYQQVRQSLRYAVQSTQPDSVRVVVVDNQSVQATPVFARHIYAETVIWHYAGLSADVVWQLNRQTSRSWQHYLTAGATLGRFMGRSGGINGFFQAAYGIERPLAPGLRLRIEPTVQLGWQTLTDATQRFQSRPYGYGLALGVRFN